LPEEVELVWDDTVAPESCIDIDAPHVSANEVLATFFGAFAFFFGLYTITSWTDPVRANPVAPRAAVIPPNVLSNSLALGSGEASEEDEDDE
jgi:hypothetical protein